jgi:hypothetical protein
MITPPVGHQQDRKSAGQVLVPAALFTRSRAIPRSLSQIREWSRVSSFLVIGDGNRFEI